MYMKPTKLYQMARSTLTKRDLERSEIALASCGQRSLPYLSSCYCAPALSYTWGHHEKVEGHSKKIIALEKAPDIVPLHFQIASGATERGRSPLQC